MQLDIVKSWLLEVGEIQREAFMNNDFQIESKSTSIDLVTSIDKQSELLIRKRILETYPSHSILGEEGGRTGESDYLWIIDPLDGTTNFAQGLPMFAISIALDYLGETIVGGVYHPLLDQMFLAKRGEGATMNGQIMKVGSKESIADAVLATGFPYDRRSALYNNSKNIEKMIPRVRGVRRMGAAAYDLALVAAGRLDGYWELNIKPWDCKAANLMIEEAGGVVEFLPKHRGVSLVTGSKVMVEQIKEILGAFNG